MWPFDSLSAAPLAPTEPTPPLHPYYPLEIEIIDYLANEHSVPTLLALFTAGCTAVFALTHAVVKRVRPGLPTSELLTILWFVLSGCIHAFFEGVSNKMTAKPAALLQ